MSAQEVVALTAPAALAQVRLLVVGDVMLDRYWFGDVSRISPEAPVPIVRIEKREERLGVLKPTRQRSFAQTRAAASPRERKVWALWNQLHRDGVIQNHSAPALNAWVKRQVGVDALRFCNAAQLDSCIEGLKAMHARGSAA